MFIDSVFSACEWTISGARLPILDFRFGVPGASVATRPFISLQVDQYKDKENERSCVEAGCCLDVSSESDCELETTSTIESSSILSPGSSDHYGIYYQHYTKLNRLEFQETIAPKWTESSIAEIISTST